MVNWGFYGDLVMYIGDVLGICISGILFWRFVKPFLDAKERTWVVGITYAVVMLALKYYPYEINNQICYGIGVAVVFLVMYWLDKRNPEQKVFLAVTFYLLEWIAWGVILGPWDMMYQVVVMRPSFMEHDFLQWVLWLVMELLFVTMDASAKGLLIKVIHGAYHYKQENMTKREFALLLAPSLSVMVGYWIISYFCNIYEMYSGQYIEDTHQEYIWFRALYMTVSFAALLTVIISYQHIKDGQRKEKEEAVLSRQMEDMKKHLNEVERLYVDIRSLKHDMANHVMVLESLYGQGRLEEDDGEGEISGNHRSVKEGESGKIAEKRKIAREYMTQLKKHVEKTILEIQSGNPITDVILREKHDEAMEKGISFCSEFHYPAQTNVDVFDVSIILNNALNNAMEAAGDCENSFVLIKSYRMRNAWMIEIRNSIMGLRVVDEESGLPTTTKKEAGHGFGLISIRRVAQKYNGDIDISQEGKEFVLNVMLMISAKEMKICFTT